MIWQSYPERGHLDLSTRQLKSCLSTQIHPNTGRQTDRQTDTHTQRALSKSQASQFSPRASCQPCPTGSSERGGRGRGRSGGGAGGAAGRTLASGAAAQRRLQTAQQMGATNSTNRPARLGAGPPITPTIGPRAPVFQDKRAKRLPCAA